MITAALIVLLAAGAGFAYRLARRAVHRGPCRRRGRAADHRRRRHRRRRGANRAGGVLARRRGHHPRQLHRHGHRGPLHRKTRLMIAEAMVLCGAVLILLAAVGVVRFDDVLTRMHALTKASTLGLLLVLIGAAIYLRDQRLHVAGLAGAATAHLSGVSPPHQPSRLPRRRHRPSTRRRR